jgi:hypothetical protein
MVGPFTAHELGSNSDNGNDILDGSYTHGAPRTA